jgi:DNA-binding beta-propeller fold protein YncE
MKQLVIAFAASVAAASALTASAPLSMAPIGTLKTGPQRGEDPRIAEINAYDALGRRVYVVNPRDSRLDVLDVSNPAAPTAAAPVDIVGDCQQALGDDCPVLSGSEPNSIAIHGFLMAVAVANAVRTDNGHAVFYWLRWGAPPIFLAAVEAGALPDMITFSDFGRYVLVANEGEPNQAYSIDPPGSVTIIDTWWPWGPRAVRHVGFERFDQPALRARLEQDGVRIFGPGATVAQDLEPEYIAVEGNNAYVTLQENNALAVINIAGGFVEKVVGLGLKDHSTPCDGLDVSKCRGLDPSDQDSATNSGINIANWPVHGLYEPDAIYAFRDRFFRTFLITANEGDAREYAGYVEALRVNNAAYVLDPAVFPSAAALKGNAALGRLNVSTASGDTDGDGDFDRIETFGGRSVSIRDTHGRLVWDSGEMFERLSQTFDGTLTVFNTTNTANSRDNRSDDKGVEPESVVVGEVRGRPYAFVGLERDSGIVVLDLSTPAAPAFVTYVTNRKLPRNPTTGAFLACNDTNDCGDLGPEGLTFVPAWQSPTGKALLIVSNEVSSTTTVWQIE